MKSTKWAEKYLRQNKCWQIHSIYHRTVNIYAGERILAFHPHTIALTPLSVSLPLSGEEFAFWAKTASEEKKIELVWQQSSPVWLYAGKFGWNVGTYECWNSKIMGTLNKTQMRLALLQMEESLTRYSSLGGFADSVFCSYHPHDDQMTVILRQKVQSLLKQADDLEQILTIAGEMIGLGVGLTPSGDDFTAGLLYGFRTGALFSQNDLEIFHDMVKRKVMETNDISRQYLLCACEGEFGELYHSLLQLCKMGKPITQCLEQIIKIGHTSGLDTLNGIAAGWKICCQKEKGKR